MSDIKFGELKTFSEKPDKITTADIVNLLEHKYNRIDNRGEWNGFAEVSDGCGWNKTGGIDFWAIHNWAGNQRFAYEIKISRADFLKEMKNPKKRRKALLVSNFYFFIAPEGLLKVEEIPPECGLKEVFWKTNQDEVDRCERYRSQLYGGKATEEERDKHYPRPDLVWRLDTKTTIDAPLRESLPPSWTFVASLFRRMQEIARVTK